ncbi:hypothetical protein JOC36_001091 [Weissella uvarum]|uniref:hypothetical protein n=1 Tax=Weissella uvarum TaxID=1479233 RepID=UPI00195F2E58|nr:hypothetical protein [Weissella uvarum]MBM7617534.1 hypothetical protein [Weissella uvarum]MCM0595582.1 hypothetical protein [Weissella uvarum]
MSIDIYTIYKAVIVFNLLFLVICGIGVYQGAKEKNLYSTLCYALLICGIIIAVGLTYQASGF